MVHGSGDVMMMQGGGGGARGIASAAQLGLFVSHDREPAGASGGRGRALAETAEVELVIDGCACMN